MIKSLRNVQVIMLFRTISMWQCVIKHSRGVCSSLRISGAKTGGTSEPSGVPARAIRAHWVLALSIFLLALATAGVITWQTTPLYAASTRLFVSTPGRTIPRPRTRAICSPSSG